MAKKVKLRVTKLEDLGEILDMKVRDMYEPDEDGDGYVLHAEELPELHARLTGTETALAKERDDHKATTKRLKLYGDADPAVVRDLMARESEIINAKKIGDGKLNEVVASMNKEFDRERTTLREQLAAITAERDDFHGTLRRTSIERALEQAFNKASGRANYLDDVKLRADQFDIFDGDKVYMKDADGQPRRHPKEGARFYTPEDFVADRAKDKPDWFAPSGGGSTGQGGQRNTQQAAGTVSRDDPNSILANLDKVAKGEVVIQ